VLSSLWRQISLSSRIALSGSLVLVLVIALLLYSVIQEEVARLRTEFALKITRDAAGGRRPDGETEAWGQAAGAAGAAKRNEREYLNIAIVAYPRVAQGKVSAVRTALLHMGHDPVGLQILTASAALIQLDPRYGFVATTDSEYDNIRTLFKHALVNRD